MLFDFICLYFANIFSAIFSIGGPMNLLSFTATPLPSAFALVVCWTKYSTHTISSLSFVVSSASIEQNEYQPLLDELFPIIILL